MTVPVMPRHPTRRTKLLHLKRRKAEAGAAKQRRKAYPDNDNAVRDTTTEGEKSASGKARGRSRRKNEAHPDELPPPPECKGNTFHDTDHVPAFLLR